eukprot:scaffold10861_cov180-Amphora_coffeaeformis.AAC.3
MNIDLLSMYEGNLLTSQPFVLQDSGLMTSFLTKLRSILSLGSIEHLVSWLPEGKIWRIHKIKSFINAVLPLFVEVFGWDAFLLTVASHGFKEVSRGFDSVAFYSEAFTRDECYLTAHCGSSSSDVVRQSLRPESIFSSQRTIHDNETLRGAARALALQLGTKQRSPQLGVSKTNQGMNLVDLLRMERRAKGATDHAPYENCLKRKMVEELSSSSSSSSSEPTKRKKPKKKWLPPLGPPEAESAAILGKRQAGAWGHTSAEAFSTLSGLHR